ncbi:MAG: hypothetical protein WBA89_23290 [Microcoleus sp.]
MKTSTKYLTGKSTYVTMNLVEALINLIDRTAVVKSGNNLKNTLYIAPQT